ncbi:FAD-dependent oxidoreductase [Histidinibacterium aquaticum]|uniref:FAD-dependent oxidoreductase n=1 Tax=Histidinibacterium aquaticum TaxID=2613962 RepID=A0A5J5G9Y1_9RHOB|nr:FAD-dependent oxidoreductase [Histidinibacterium aquaticum]KAA9004989.1 FAD-dependent oxidoreductase [Histidinibacterium aquaticum]
MTMSSKPGLTRRSVLGSVGAGVGAFGLAGASVVEASLLPEPERMESFDVVVVGSGMAGCAAALQASESGARVVLLEKLDENRMGGNSLLAGGSYSVPLGTSQAARDDYVADYVSYCLGRGNETIFRLMAEHIHGDLDWLGSRGVELLAAEERPPNRVATVQTAPAAFAGMPRAFRTLKGVLSEAGVALMFETKARQLIMDESGAVVGVRALGADGVADYLGRAVVIATGGYAANSQILEGYSDPNAGAMMVRGVKSATGDGHVMAQAAGAGLKGMGGLMALHVAAVDGIETAAGQPARVVPYAISINQDGRRFVDESRGYVAHGKAVLEQPGQATSLIFDQALRESVAEGVIGTFERLGRPFHQANTLEDLAELVGAPVDEFVRTVENFNAAVEDGAAPGANPPKAKLANRIETPPFYAFSPLVPGVTLTFGAVMIDADARVLEPDGRVVPGLYAAGEGAGPVFFHDYIGGGALTNCLVMGRIAGRNASA